MSNWKLSPNSLCLSFPKKFCLISTLSNPSSRSLLLLFLQLVEDTSEVSRANCDVVTCVIVVHFFYEEHRRGRGGGAVAVRFRQTISIVWQRAFKFACWCLVSACGREKYHPTIHTNITINTTYFIVIKNKSNHANIVPKLIDNS